MKIAVVTPIGQGHANESILEGCRATVYEQAYPGCSELYHVCVGDGCVDCVGEGSVQVRDNFWYESLSTPRAANNAGATPRAMGSSYAVGTLGADLVAFLDADNSWEPNHLAVAVELAKSGMEVIASNRLICRYDTGEPMFADTESNGEKFADTNTIVLAGRAAKFGATFDWPAPYANQCAETGADRVFWERLRRSFDRTRVATGIPTVRYRSTWLAHYLPGHEPPPIAKVMMAGPDGKLVAVRVRPKQLWLQHPESGYWYKPVQVSGEDVQLDMDNPHDCEGLITFGNRGWEVEEA